MSLFAKKPQPLVETLEVSDEPEEVPPLQKWGQPGRCPSCGGQGYLDRIQLRERVMYQHCLECRQTWQTAEKDLESSV